MHLDRAMSWGPPPDWLAVDVIDSHTGGEPFRLVVGGLPEIPGDTVLEMRRFARENLDWLRRALMLEPRGHADMYGGWLGAPVSPDSDLSVLFLHNEGFSTMCGHGIIALSKIVLDTGILPINYDATILRIDTPAGQIVSNSTTVAGRVGEVRFTNVPSFVDSLDNVVFVESLGHVRYDLAFGGAYYAYVSAPGLGMVWPPARQSELIDAGRVIKKAIEDDRPIIHPEQAELGFLYGVIFAGPPLDPSNDYRNVCVFADGEVDRSPTGTGVSGRIAIDAARGDFRADEVMRIESVVGSVFEGSYKETTMIGGYQAVVPVIGGTASITGRSTYWIDPEDRLGAGFLIR
ncbi:MAG TPA: proline racemase family protein [Acidimicrobiia bacterium]